jgi:hypothetical protein
MILDVAFWTDAGRGGPHTSRVSVLVPEASSDEAPVALRYRNPPSGWDKSPEQGEIRLFANRLYRPYATGDRHCAKPVRRTSQWMAIVAARPETANLLGVRNSYHERTEGEHHLQSWASEMLMIDGSPWRPTPEPLLAVEGTPTTHLGWKKAPAPVVKVRDDGGAPNGKLGLPRVHPANCSASTAWTWPTPGRSNASGGPRRPAPKRPC